jgi:hypothetical protein
VDAWRRYLDDESGTTGTSDTSDAPASSGAGVALPVVPVVPDVPDARPTPSHRERDLLVAALDVFGDDLDWMPGLA